LISSNGKPHPNETPETIKLLGGSLALDFANSVDWTEALEPLDALSDAITKPAELGRWGKRLGLYTGRAPSIPAAEHEAARDLRSALYAVFAAHDAGASPDRADLDELARSYAEAAEAGWLAEDGGAWRLQWRRSDPRRVRFAVAADAVELLADPDRLARVHRCPGRNCGWLFFDRSGRRKWCTMEGCGSREKMRRLYRRQRAVHSKVA
jgi:predicted RNA-binding Zn ribbon-like protein